jgi:amino acid adenylation domain-containing protein
MGSIWEMPFGDAEMKLSDVKDADNPYDLSLGIAETPTGCVVELYALASLYGEEACATILESYIRLLDVFSQTPDCAIDGVSMHEETQVARAIGLGNGPVVEYDWAKTLSQRFQDIVQLYPDRVAVKDFTKEVTYSELNSRVQNLANTLLQGGYTKGSCVAVICEPSLDFIVSILAILHIGGIYMPLDVSLPTSRHLSMIEVGQPSLLVYHSATEGRVSILRSVGNAPFREVLLDNIVYDSSVHVSCTAEEDAHAVLLFTSGSTGKPKGITLSQANFVNHLALKSDLLRLEQEIVLQQSSLGFDMSLIQIFCALANGGRLIVAPSDLRRDPVALSNLLSEEQVTLTIATPTEYLAWFRYGYTSLIGNRGWKHACMGGEQVTRQLKNEFARLGNGGLELTNCYGPTEITAAATFQTIRSSDNDNTDDDIAVGKALPNYSVRILDTSGQPQPLGHIGEICIGGAGVAIGYLDLPAETSRKFVTDAEGQRLYRTGDQGRLLSDGTLLYLGRLEGDTQIKLRGLRIELEEVEAALVKASEGLFSGAVVSRRGDILVAHITTTAGNGDIEHESVTQILSSVKLPQYSIPASITVLPSFPMTPNGKIDRKVIASTPVSDSSSTTPAEKMTVREGEVRLLWERVLVGTTRISPSSDFFLLGGNSLLLMKLQAAIRESIMVPISTRVLYQASTLRGMAQAIDKIRQEAALGSIQSEINWDAETAIPQWLVKQFNKAASPQSRRQPKTNGIEIVMTGATGFLGGHLLQSLLASEAVDKVHCIAVPADDEASLPQHDKVQHYTGSLLSPTLGLSSDQREHLVNNVDVIIHAGSNGHCLNTYASLRTPNVESTHFLASMAAAQRIPLLFLSSNRVVLLSGKQAPHPSSVSEFHPATDGLEGHMMTRWASEAFLENLVQHIQTTGSTWPVSIHRPAVVVSDKAPNSDALNAILRFSVSMRCVPRLDRVEGYMDLAPLDKVVAELSESAINLAQGQSGDVTSVQFKHHSSGVKVPASKLREHLQVSYGVEFEELELRQWMDRAAEAGMDPLITAYMEGIVENDAPMVFPYMGELDQ